MSRPADCPSCAMGSHDRHDRAHGLRPGLIGGTYCDCTGDCAERFKAKGERFAQLWNPTLPEPPTTTEEPS